MPLFDIYSKRLKRKDKTEDVYQFNKIPQEFRVQVIHIWKDALGAYFQKSMYSMDHTDYVSNKHWDFIEQTLSREYGKFSLSNDGNSAAKCFHFILNASTEEVLDIIELSFRVISKFVSGLSSYQREECMIKIDSQEAINELNARFREHSIGYQFEDEQIIRVDSKFVHKEVVKPVLSLLNNRKYKGAEKEFRTAHDFYKQGKYKESISNANNAFESVMKSICDDNGWKYDSEKDTASKLIDILMDNNLIPNELKSQFTSLASLLKSGSPAVRNRKSGHGQGKKVVKVPGYLANFALNTVATNILFLVNANESK